MNCLRCRRPGRPQNELIAHWPGTVKIRGRGLCTSCWRAAESAGQLEDYPKLDRAPSNPIDRWTTKSCAGRCGKTVRYTRLKAADWPGTVGDKGGGNCYECHKELAHNGRRASEEALTVEQNRRNVESWLASHWRPANRVKVVRL